MPSGEVLDLLIREAERVVESELKLPAIVMAGTVRERLAVTRTGMDWTDCALAESGLRAQAGVLWTALAGEAALPSGMGMLRHAFVRVQHPGRRWEAAWRPFLCSDEASWLGEWTRGSGDDPEQGPLAALFPEPAEGTVRFIAELEVGDPAVLQDVPEGATPRDVAVLAGHLMESFFVRRGFVPPAVVRLTAQGLEVFLLPRSGPAHAASDNAIRMAQDPETLAIGLFERGRDTTIQPPAEEISLRLEFRDGPTLIWRRRYRLLDEGRARWLDSSGNVGEPPSRKRRWFV